MTALLLAFQLGYSGLDLLAHGCASLVLSQPYTAMSRLFPGAAAPVVGFLPAVNWARLKMRAT